MRLILDTNIIVAALRSPKGASAALLRAIRHRKATLILSTAMLLEYEAVCLRPEHILASGLSETEIEQVFNVLAALAEPVETHFQWRPQLRDAADEMVLEAAVNGQADAIITFNLRDFSIVPERFGIELLKPGETLKRMRGKI